MKSIEDQIEIRKAWQLWKKINELQDLLWESFWQEFLALEKKEKELEAFEKKLPF